MQIRRKSLLRKKCEETHSPPFPQALHGKKGIRNASEILEVLRQVKVNIPLLDMIKQVPTYAKFLKDLCTIKRGLNVKKKAFLTEQVSAIIQCKSPLKYKDPGCPTISVMIGGKVVEKALLDLGASVNLLPYSVYKQLGLGELKPTSITLSLADRSVKIPRGIIEDVLVQVDNFYYPVDFVVLDTDPLSRKLIMFLSSLEGHSLLPQMQSSILITPEEEEGPEEVCIIDTLVEEHCNQNMQDKLEEREEILPLFNKEEAQEAAKEETPKLNLKPLPMERCLLEVLKRCKKAIGWQISDLKGISPLRWCELSAEATSSRYYLPISDSPWVSPTQVVPKKSGITVVQNEKGEEIATRLTSGWRCLERVSGHPFYCFLDGYSGYFQIEIDVEEDQEKTTFTCPFGTYAYRRMPFGLCNAPATFQRCMLSIFSDMVERIMEVFMDDITIYGGTFEECLVNLEAVLKDALKKDLVLNWEKCHFMVHQGIVLGHIISEKGIEVDKAKVELIVKLPSPTTVKGVRQFLGHAGNFYNTPIVRAPNWQLPFEVMCDASDFAIGAVLGQREDGSPIQVSCLSVGSFIIVFTDHSALKYLLTKQDAKARLIRWILLQEFDLQIRDKKGVENVVADHLSRKTPWYAHIANYLVTGEVPSEWKAQDRKHFFAKIHAYYWEEPFLFKYCADQIIRKCVPEEEQQGILSHCHENACGGHFASQKTAMKVLQSGFTWPSLFKDAHIMFDLFDVWGIDFMGPFPMSFGNSYILVGVDYVSKWVEAIPSKYGVKHKVATPYHPQTSGQVELANREIKNIDEGGDHEQKRLSMAKHAISLWKLNIRLGGQSRIKHGLDQSGKELKSRWIGPFIIHQVHLNGVVELLNSNVDTFKVNGHRLKPFIEPFKQEEEINLLEPQKA
ncbi:Retrovirus-related Pol polyprotein from transposon 17.6 [Vitis vinifera]|uniref:Retrovirus-related Pol polyprotein from transposon 17.6 n=1 Tax=Vitis vinifera TaxID=29760 RepID=A0A438G717_VITVI|nr:Retrovirus-related Pol polyprotein from transposon 17.6 [Vitis vinifera]